MNFMDVLKLKIGDGQDGQIRFAFTVEDIHLGSDTGVLHGGFISTLVDMAIARAVRSVVPSDMDIMTVALNIHFCGGVSSGVVNVAGRTTFVGKRVIHGEAEIMSGDRLVAHGSGTWYAKPRRAAAS